MSKWKLVKKKEDRRRVNCGEEFEEMAQIREAVKPPRQHRRWVIMGYCCSVCMRSGVETTIDPWAE